MLRVKHLQQNKCVNHEYVYILFLCFRANSLPLSNPAYVYYCHFSDEETMGSIHAPENVWLKCLHAIHIQ